MPFWSALIVAGVVGIVIGEILRRERRKIRLTPQQEREAEKLIMRTGIAYFLFATISTFLVVAMRKTVGIGDWLAWTLLFANILGIFLSIYWMALGCYKQVQKHESTS